MPFRPKNTSVSIPSGSVTSTVTSNAHWPGATGERSSVTCSGRSPKTRFGLPACGGECAVRSAGRGGVGRRARGGRGEGDLFFDPPAQRAGRFLEGAAHHVHRRRADEAGDEL